MVELKPIKEADCQFIIDWNNGKDDDYLIQWAGNKAYTYPIDIQQIVSRLNSSTSIIYLITADGTAIGSVELDSIDKNAATARVCRFILCDEVKNKGIGTLALKRLSDIAFNEMKLNRLTLGVFCYNVGAIRCYEKCGFLIKEYHQREDVKWNAYTMELLNNSLI
jgi:RimJ/RimL family protein N-acetyltransferase